MFPAVWANNPNISRLESLNRLQESQSHLEAGQRQTHERLAAIERRLELFDDPQDQSTP